MHPNKKHATRDLVTVITVVKNDASNIAKTLMSVLRQSYPHIQYIILDGASTDGTLEILRTFSGRIDVLISGQDYGIYDAMNRGIHQALGEWVFFLNSGDVFNNENVLTDLSRFFGTNNDLIFGDAIIIDKNGEQHIQSHKPMSRFTLLKRTICHQSILFKRQLFTDIGLFSMDYRIKADYEWLLRFYLKHKKNSEHVGIIITQYTKGGISDDAEKDRVEKIELVKKYFTIWEYALTLVINSRSLLINCRRSSYKTITF